MEIVAALGPDILYHIVIMIPKINLLSQLGHIIENQLPLLALGALGFQGRAASDADTVLREFQLGDAGYYVVQAGRVGYG